MDLATQDWSTEQLMTIARRSWVVLVIVVFISLSIIWPMIGGLGLIIWAALLVLLALMLALLAAHYARHSPHKPHSTAVYAKLHNLVVLLIGLTWGIGILLVRHDEVAAILFIFVLSGTALGAVSSQHSYLPSSLTSIWSSLLPVGLATIFGTVAGLPTAIGGLLLIYGVTLSGIASKMHDFLAQHEELTRAFQDKVVRLSETSREIDQARSAAEAANRAKSETLAQVSHDLRHPLHAIGLLANTLKDAQSTEERQQIVRQIDQAVGGLSRVFSLLLENERLERGETPVHLSTVALLPLLEAVRAAVPQGDNGPEIRQVCGAISVETDPRLLSVMILNLLDNARKYAREGRILVGCRRRNERVEIWVCDQGPGIAEHDLERLFEPFNRLRPKDLSTGDGTGLGLAITQKMAHLLGLKIQVMSQKGQGTTFVIKGLLPVEAIAVAEVAMTRSPNHPLKGLTVTLLDEDQKRQDLHLALLDKWGCVVMLDIQSTTDIVLLGTLSKNKLASLGKRVAKHGRLSIIPLDPQWAADSLPPLLNDCLVSRSRLKPFQLRSLLQSLVIR